MAASEAPLWSPTWRSLGFVATPPAVDPARGHIAYVASTVRLKRVSVNHHALSLWT